MTTYEILVIDLENIILKVAPGIDNRQYLGFKHTQKNITIYLQFSIDVPANLFDLLRLFYHAVI